MDPMPYLEDPMNKDRRARFLVQIRTLIKKIKTIPDFRYDLLDHLSKEFPELNIEHLFENPYAGYPPRFSHGSVSAITHGTWPFFLLLEPWIFCDLKLLDIL